MATSIQNKLNFLEQSKSSLTIRVMIFIKSCELNSFLMHRDQFIVSRGRHSTEVEFSLTDPAAPGSNTGDSKNFYGRKNFVNSWIPDATNPRPWLEERGQRLDSVDQTHSVLASGILVLQKVNRIHQLSRVKKILKALIRRFLKNHFTVHDPVQHLTLFRARKNIYMELHGTNAFQGLF